MDARFVSAKPKIAPVAAVIAVVATEVAAVTIVVDEKTAAADIVTVATVATVAAVATESAIAAFKGPAPRERRGDNLNISHDPRVTLTHSLLPQNKRETQVLPFIS